MVLTWEEYKYHQKTGWKFFKEQEKKKCDHQGKQYYDRSDKKTKCSICKQPIK